MHYSIPHLFSVACAATALSACSLNPRFDVPYTAVGQPNLAVLVDELYCELMKTANDIDPSYRKNFLKEDMTATLTLQVIGTDSIAAAPSFPAVSSVLLAVTGNINRQQTNQLVLVLDYPVGQLYSERNDPSKATIRCNIFKSYIQGGLNIEKTVASSYASVDKKYIGFEMPATEKTVSDGQMSGETDFALTRSLNPAKASFLINTVLGSDTFDFSDAYTDKFQYTFNPAAVPKPTPSTAVYIVNCPKGKDCAPLLKAAPNGNGVNSNQNGTKGNPGGQPAKPAVNTGGAGPKIRLLNPDALDQLNRLNFLALPPGSTLETH